MKFFWTFCFFLYALGACAQDFIKCGTEMMVEARRKGLAHPKLGRVPLGKAPTTPDSIVSPNGLFRIHFSETGDSAATTDYVQFVANEAEAAYRYQCDTLGFPKPPFSSADSMWHIYILNLSDLIYGFTAYIDSTELGVTPAGFTKLRSFIVIDNDYKMTPTTGLDAARITIQHEFFHVIQFGCYGALKQSDGYVIDDINFVEMSSVWMEMVSTPWVPDYLFFLDMYLANIDKSVDKVPNSGYSQGIWPKFIEQRFGEKIMHEVWENYGSQSADPLKAFEHGISLHGSTFCNEYKRFGRELIETGRRYRGTTTLPDASKYPVDKLKIVRLASGTSYTFAGSSRTQPASLNIVAAGFGKDTTFVTIARNTDFVTAEATVTVNAPLEYTVQYDSPDLFCDTVSNPRSDTLKAYAFPVPFVISQHGDANIMRILASNNALKPASPARVTIYTASMKLVRRIESEPEYFGGNFFLEWDGKDDTGGMVSSGNYIYTMEVDGKTTVGKFPVIVAEN